MKIAYGGDGHFTGSLTRRMLHGKAMLLLGLEEPLSSLFPWQKPDSCIRSNNLHSCQIVFATANSKLLIGQFS